MISGLTVSRSENLWRWTAAALIVTLLHAGAVFLLTEHSYEEPVDEEPSGVISIELAPLTNEASAPESDLAPSSAATQPPTPLPTKQPEQEQPEENAPVPLAEPSPAMKPEVQVSVRPPDTVAKEQKPPMQKVEQKKDAPKESEKKAEPVAMVPVAPQRAAHEASQVTSEMQSRAKPLVAARQGRTSRPSEALLKWQKALVLKLERGKRYPAAARQKHLEGTTTVGFSIDRQGRVIFTYHHKLRRCSARSGSAGRSGALNAIASSSPRYRSSGHGTGVSYQISHQGLKIRKDECPQLV